MSRSNVDNDSYSAGRDRSRVESALLTSKGSVLSLDPDASDAPNAQEVEEIAKVYKCDPERLVKAAGRQLRRVDGDEQPLTEHRDVLALESVARLLAMSQQSLDDLPEFEKSAIAIVGHIRHAQTCGSCRAQVERFLQLFPKASAVATATRLPRA